MPSAVARLVALLALVALASGTLAVPAGARDGHQRHQARHHHARHHHRHHKRHRRHHHRRHHRAHHARHASLATCQGTDLQPVGSDLPVVRRAILCLLNHERADRGLTTLRIDRRLDAASVEHSADMVRRRYFDHVTPGGQDVVDRLREVGYVDSRHAWHVGENIAWGTGDLATAAQIVDAWMHSPGHRANILDPDYREIGIGVELGNPQTGGGGATYTTDFGRLR